MVMAVFVSAGIVAALAAAVWGVGGVPGLLALRMRLALVFVLACVVVTLIGQLAGLRRNRRGADGYRRRPSPLGLSPDGHLAYLASALPPARPGDLPARL